MGQILPMQRKASLPRDYVPRYTSDEIDRRTIYLAERCFEFLKAIENENPTWELDFDPLVLMDVAASAMEDIWCFKVRHLKNAQKRSDAIKRAAYFTKWIVKYRPIYFLRPTLGKQFSESFDPNDSTLMINESFALHVALGSLATEARKPHLFPTPELLADLLFDLHRRSLSDEGLMMMYQLLRSVARNEKILQVKKNNQSS